MACTIFSIYDLYTPVNIDGPRTHFWKTRFKGTWLGADALVLLMTSCTTLPFVSGKDQDFTYDQWQGSGVACYQWQGSGGNSALCGYPLLKFPEEIFFTSPPFSWDPIISDRIFRNCLLPSFTFDIFLRTSWIWSTRDGEFATESVAFQIGCRKDVIFFGYELNVKS